MKKLRNMAQYTFRVTGKGQYNAPKGATVQVVKSSSTITMTDIKDAFKKQLGVDVTGSTSNYDIKKNVLNHLQVYNSMSNESNNNMEEGLKRHSPSATVWQKSNPRANMDSSTQTAY